MRGAGQEDVVSVVEGLMVIAISGATKNLYGEIEVEKVEENGRLTT